MSWQGGIVLEVESGLCFIHVSSAVAVIRVAQVVPVPGMIPPAAGIAVTDTGVVAVLAVGTHASEELVVCESDGNTVALAGGRVLATGRFPTAPGDSVDVLFRGRRAKRLDVRALYFEAETAIWRSRAAHDDARRS